MYDVSLREEEGRSTSTINPSYFLRNTSTFNHQPTPIKMTVKEVFDLRRQGRIEEAYEAIRPMYAVHKGKFTTLAMFWTASDILKKRLTERRIDEAFGIFKALLRLLPNVDDAEGRCHTAMIYAVLRMADAIDTFLVLDYIGQINLTANDWQPLTDSEGKPLPPVAHRIVRRLFLELRLNPTVERALQTAPYLQESIKHHPENKDNQRTMAFIYEIMGEHEKAQAACPSVAEHLRTGRWGEDVAAAFLRKKGYAILEHDWHSGHRDLDLVARDGQTIVFVEVKTRSNRDFGNPEDAIDYQKRENLRRSMNHYIKSHRLSEAFRFDIITVVGTLGSIPEITHFIDVPLHDR